MCPRYPIDCVGELQRGISYAEWGRITDNISHILKRRVVVGIYEEPQGESGKKIKYRLNLGTHLPTSGSSTVFQFWMPLDEEVALAVDMGRLVD